MITRREVVWGGVGAALGMGGVGHRFGAIWRGPAARGPAEVWLADRAAGAVWSCDGDGGLLARVQVPAPIALAPDGTGGVWVVSALEGVPLAAHQLLHLAPDGAFMERTPCAPPPLRHGPRILVCAAGQRVVVIEGVGGRAVASSLTSKGLCASPLGCEPRAIAARRGFLWCLGERGDLVALRMSGAAIGMGAGVELPRCSSRATDRLPREATGLDLALDHDGRGAWVLGRTPGRSCIGRWHLDADGTPRRVWLRWLSFEAAAIAATRGGCAWIADARAPRAVALSGEGRVTVWRADLPGEGIEDVLAHADGGAWFAAAGALLRVGPSGESRPGQGRLGHVVSLASAIPMA
ncbi:MAG: hypothetical protein R3F49_04230 [Planctomycetota bacterium]